jgi:hypothetical protein
MYVLEQVAVANLILGYFSLVLRIMAIIAVVNSIAVSPLPEGIAIRTFAFMF